jgi:predicted HTH transcriptional regulator
MDDIQSLLGEIAAGEDTFLELKEVVFKGDQVRFAREEGKAQVALAEVFVSMANTEGGIILFGVNNNREIVGIDERKRDLLEQFVVNLCLNNCRPGIDPLLDWLYLPNVENQSVLCLKVTVPKAKFYVHSTADGRYLKRVGSHRTNIPAEQLGRLLSARRLAVPAEERPLFRVGIEVLDRLRFEAYYQRRFGVAPDQAGVDIPQIYLNLKLAVRDETEELRTTRLGALLFSERPDSHINGAFIDVAAYTGAVADGTTADSRRIYGPLPEQIEQMLQYFRTSPLIARPSRKDAGGRLDFQTYSLLALQEGVVNALVHRDYELEGSQVRIFLFPDRIEIWNPGALHNTLTVEDLYRGCQPIRRNQLLAGFMREYVSPETSRSYMESRGEGFLTLIRESERVSGRRPQMKVVGQAVCLTIYAAPEALDGPAKERHARSLLP